MGLVSTLNKKHEELGNICCQPQLRSHPTPRSLKGHHLGSLGSGPRMIPCCLAQTSFLLLPFRSAHLPSQAPALWARRLHESIPQFSLSLPLSVHVSWAFSAGTHIQASGSLRYQPQNHLHIARPRCYLGCTSLGL